MIQLLGKPSSDPLVLWIRSMLDDKLNDIIRPRFTLGYINDDLIYVSTSIGIVAIVEVVHHDLLNNKRLSDSVIKKLQKDGYDMSHLNFFIRTNGYTMKSTRDFKLYYSDEFNTSLARISNLLKCYSIKTLEKILSKFDNPITKKYSLYDVSIEIGELDATEKNRFESQCELLALDFVEDPSERSPWGTYFGPKFVGQNGEYPNPSMITPAVIVYWESRMNKSSNPILISQYAGLLWDFRQQITGLKADGALLDSLIESLIKCAEGDYVDHAMTGMQKLVRAFKLAQQSKKESLYPRIKKVFADYDTQYHNDDHVGVWGIRYSFMMENEKLFTEDEQLDIIHHIEGTFDRLLAKDPNLKNAQGLDPYKILDVATMLCNYYKKSGNKEKIKDFLRKVDEAYDKSLFSKSGLQTQNWLSQMIRVYNSYQLKDEASKKMLQLQQYGEITLKELQSNKLEFELPKEVVEQLETNLTTGTIEEIFQKLVFQFLPDKDAIEEHLKEVARYSPLIFLAHTQQLDYKGRPKSIIRSIENDIEGHLVLQSTQMIEITSALLRSILNKLKEMGVWSADKLFDYVRVAPFIDADRNIIIKRGLDAYFADDYLVSISLLIPQIEDSIRNILEANGGVVIKPQREKRGYQVKTFNEILVDPIIKDVFGKDASYYLRILFTDQRGMNLRNDVCHGLAPSNKFSSLAADRVVHALLLLGLLGHMALKG